MLICFPCLFPAFLYFIVCYYYFILCYYQWIPISYLICNVILTLSVWVHFSHFVHKNLFAGQCWNENWIILVVYESKCSNKHVCDMHFVWNSVSQNKSLSCWENSWFYKGSISSFICCIYGEQLSLFVLASPAFSIIFEMPCKMRSCSKLTG